MFLFAAVLVIFKVIIDELIVIFSENIQMTISPLLLSLLSLVLIATLLIIGYLFFTKKLNEHKRKNDWTLFNKKKDVDIEFTKLRDGLLKIEKKLRKEVALEKSMNMDIVERKEKKHNNNVINANKAFQRLIDALYKDKARMLLSAATIENKQSILKHMHRETKHYQKLIVDIEYLGLTDNANWIGLKTKFLDKIEYLTQAEINNEPQLPTSPFDNQKQLFTEDLGEGKTKNETALSLQA